MKPKKRLVFITNIPNNYRIPLFNELNKQLQTTDYVLHVIFGASGYNKRKSTVSLSDCEFNFTVLKPGVLNSIEKKTGFLFYSGLSNVLSKLNPDEILVTGFALSTIKIWLSTFFKKRRYYIVSGSINTKNKSTSWTRKIQRKLLIQRAAGGIVYGTLAKEYLVYLGMDTAKIVIMGNTVDTGFYKSETTRLKQQIESNESRKNKKHLTYIGYINPRKNVEHLIGVIEKLITLRKDIILDIVGDGESLKEIKSLVIGKNLQEYVAFHGFVQKEGLPKYMAISNIFLFQTSFDIWGLVLNEAMAAGIPCLASINAGSTFDLIEDGVTGFQSNFEDYEKTSKKIDWMLNHSTEMREIGKNASNFISEEYSLQKSAQRILSILQT